MRYVGLAAIAVLVFVVGIVVRTGTRSRVKTAATPPDTRAAQRKFLLLVLRSAPAQLEAEPLEAAAASAWIPRFGINEDGSAFVERGVPNLMMILQAHGNAFSVTGIAGPRTCEPPTSCDPETAGQLWGTNSHDVSVGVLHDFDTDQRKLAAYVATLAAQFCDADALAVYHPATRRLWAITDAIRAELAAGSERFFDAA